MERGRRLRKVAALLVVCLLGVASVSHAVIDMDPASFRTTPIGQLQTTYQSWDFSVDVDVVADTGSTYNPYGAAVAIVGAADVHHNTYAFFQGVWELNDGMSVNVPNNTANTGPGSVKNVWLQITYMGAAPDISITPAGGVKQSLTVVGTPQTMFGWTQATYDIQISPNPTYEDIVITPTQGTLYVEGMIIETQCIPEPASIALIGLGALLLRRKK